jgi:hypothetical protein
VFIYQGADTGADTERAGPTRGSRRRWHAVAIAGTAVVCGAARACKDSRYLSTAAPRLPLEGCDAACCDCRYVHFDDRRRGPRRAEEKSGAPTKPAAVNQRERRGRRAADFSGD